MNNSLRAIAIATLGLGIAAGCNDNNVKPASSDKLQPVYQSVDCGLDQAASRLTWIGDQAEFDEVYTRVRSTTLGTGDQMPEVDFDTHGLVLIELGQRPTAGYRLGLASQRLVMDKGDGLITFSIDKPVGVAAQVITSPCLLVSVPRGDYVGVRALSTDTTVNVQTTLPESGTKYNPK